LILSGPAGKAEGGEEASRKLLLRFLEASYTPKAMRTGQIHRAEWSLRPTAARVAISRIRFERFGHGAWGPFAL
jgi:hypothetical protein